MLDTSPLMPMQRSAGEALVSLRAGAGGRAALVDLRQAGSAKALLPRTGGDLTEVVYLNTSGGLTGGDRLGYQLTLAEGARAQATTQSAERCYASMGGSAQVDVALRLGAGARLDWLPQETILFQDASLHRCTEVDLAEGASCLLAETLVLGRAAMGERLTRVALTDRRVVRRQGVPVWAETLRLDDAVLQATDNPALLAGARAFAVVALIAPGAEDAAAAVQRLLTETDCQGAVSGWNGKCVVRIMAQDGWPLRRMLAPVLAQLSGHDLPRVWTMGGMA